MEWQDTELSHRIRWARQKAGYERATDAARSLNIKPVTYRTYEQPKADGGREPPNTEVQRIARKFRVDWVWLLSGQGQPEEPVPPDPRLAQINDEVADLDQARKDAALDAALSVVVSLTNRRR